MTFRSLRLFCTALAFSALACASNAQRTVPPLNGAQPIAAASFAIPQTTDPGRLTITVEGQTYEGLDGVNAGDQLGGPITGMTLTTSSPAGPAGIEIHGLLPTFGSTANTKIIDIDLFTTYTGPLSASTFSDPFFVNVVPWDVMRIDPIPGFFQGFRFTASDPNSVPIDDRLDPFFNFALLNVQFTNLATPADMALFNDSLFAVRGFTTIQQTPEPGTCALLGALVVSGGVAWRRRRKQTV